MGVKRGRGPAGADKTGEKARARHEKALKAKRHARIVLGIPPPSQALTPKRMKPPKHKRPLDAEQE